MTISISVVLPLLIALIGVIAYFVSSHAKVSEVGRIMFFCGLLAFLLTHK